MTETHTPITSEDRFTVAGFSGVAFYKYADVVEHPDEFDSEDEANDHYFDERRGICGCPVNPDRIIAVMVGDDREHIVEVADCTLIDADEYCSGCGQIGCGW